MSDCAHACLNVSDTCKVVIYNVELLGCNDIPTLKIQSINLPHNNHTFSILFPLPRQMQYQNECTVMPIIIHNRSRMMLWFIASAFQARGPGFESRWEHSSFSFKSPDFVPVAPRVAFSLFIYNATAHFSSCQTDRWLHLSPARTWS